jgi:hypothetical protein
METKKIKPRKRRILGEMKRNRRLTLNYTTSEFEQVKTAAQGAGVTMAVFVRRLSLVGEVIARLGEEDRHLFQKVVEVSNTLNGLYKLAQERGSEQITNSLMEGRDAVDRLLNKLKL